jgi:phasin family protein
MFPFSQSVNPAVRTHIDAQTAFLNDMAKSMFHSFQQMCNLNIQLMQTMVEESTLAGQQLLTADRAPEVISAAASRAQPATDKIRAYQQHISRLAADTQVDLARVTEQHAQNTSRTARALADEVARTASEETERGIRTQQENMRQYSDPFARPDGGAQQQQQRQQSQQQRQQSQQPQQPQQQSQQPQQQSQQPPMWADNRGATMQSGQQGMSQGGASQPGSGMQYATGEGSVGGMQGGQGPSGSQGGPGGAGTGGQGVSQQGSTVGPAGSSS